MKTKCIILFLFISIQVFSQTRIFTVDFNTPLGTFKSLGNVNSKILNSTDSGYHDMGIKVVRTHGFEESDYWKYTSGFVNLQTGYYPGATYNASFDPQLPANYHFDSGGTDNLITNIVSNGYQPYFRLGVGWPNFSDTIGNGVCTPCIPLSPPSDIGDSTFHTFASICAKTVLHYTQGWDTGYTYTMPYWEVWNEPDGVFWKGTPEQFYQLYREAADSIKGANSTVKVGTCGATRNSMITHDTTYVNSLIHYCNVNDVPLDFYSWHMYKQYNPFNIKNFALNVRAALDSNGFTNTESHISEINSVLEYNSVYDTTAKGAAYVASLLMTCQQAPVDNVLWFAGNGIGPLANADIAGNANLAWKGYGMKAHNTLVSETPIKITTTGDSAFYSAPIDTTNIMIVAGKDSSLNRVDILISNLHSGYIKDSIIVSNLPFNSGDILQIEQYKTQDPDNKFTLTSATVAGSSSLTLIIDSAKAPSVYLIKIFKIGVTGIKEMSNKNNIVVSPNPVDNRLTFSETLADFEVYNAAGQLVLPIIKSAKGISTQHLKDGAYFISANNTCIKFIVKH